MGGDIGRIQTDSALRYSSGVAMQGNQNIAQDQAITISTDDVAEIKLRGKKQKDDPHTQDKEDKADVHTLNDVATSLGPLISQLKGGENLTIKIDEKSNSIEAHKFLDKSNRWETFTHRAGSMLRAAREFTAEIFETEPNFIFQQATSVAKNALMKLSFIEGLPAVTKNFLNIGLYPGVRFVLSLLDAKKAVESVKDKTAPLHEKIINVGHFITDVGGVVGGLAAMAGLCVPGAQALVATALVADILTLGYQGIKLVTNKLPHSNQQDKPNGNNTGNGDKPDTPTPTPQPSVNPGRNTGTTTPGTTTPGTNPLPPANHVGEPSNAGKTAGGTGPQMMLDFEGGMGTA